jgi:hypothetical protein
MGQQISRPGAPELERLRRRFTHWRRSGRRGRKIPDELWNEAADLARTHSVTRVARGLGLDYKGLKQRVGEGWPKAKLLPNVQGANFIELSLDRVARIPHCVMECQGSHGTLTIQLTEPEAADVVLLAKALTRGER